jgi:hypothetical protein
MILFRPELKQSLLNLEDSERAGVGFLGQIRGRSRRLKTEGKEFELIAKSTWETKGHRRGPRVKCTLFGCPGNGMRRPKTGDRRRGADPSKKESGTTVTISRSCSGRCVRCVSKGEVAFIFPRSSSFPMNGRTWGRVTVRVGR